MTAPARAVGSGTYRQVFLPAEAIYCARDPAIVTTVLGSCIAVCLWDRRQHFGGANHFVLPRHHHDTPSARYGDVAIAMLLDEMLRLDARPADIEAKIFGGAAVLPTGPDAHTVGGDNAVQAVTQLQEARIRIAAQRTGGAHGMHLRFNSGTGQVLLRPLAKTLAVGPTSPPVIR